MQIYLIRETGTSRISFGTSEDVQVELSTRRDTSASQPEILSIIDLKDTDAVLFIERVLCWAYKPYQDGEWYTLPEDQAQALTSGFKYLSTVLNRNKLPSKKHPRSKLMRAVDWLRNHDPNLGLSVREASERSGIPHATIHRAARYLLSLRQSE